MQVLYLRCVQREIDGIQIDTVLVPDNGRGEADRLVRHGRGCMLGEPAEVVDRRDRQWPPSSPSFVADIGSAILPNPVKGPAGVPSFSVVRCTLMIQEHVMCLSALLVKSLDAHFASPRVQEEKSLPLGRVGGELG